jgi:hypothetical protein
MAITVVNVIALWSETAVAYYCQLIGGLIVGSPVRLASLSEMD